MAAVTGVFDAVKNIYRGKETWRLKVRVVRMWVICAKENPSNVFSVEMVLVDAEGGRIQASIRKAMLKKFMGNVVEGDVYKMTFFGVIDNLGTYRATTHECKLLFQPRTKVYPCESEVISRFGLDVKTSEEIHQTSGDSEYLFDFMGVLTVVGEEKQCEKFNRTIRVLELELTDDKGVVRCSLFGHFIDLMKDYLKNRSVDELDILVIQFARLKSYMGKNSLHTLSNSTRVLWNPHIQEAVSFKNGVAFHGFDLHAPMKMIGGNDRPYTLREEFINHFPRKTIEDLQLMEEAVNYDDDTDTYYCVGCEANVTDVTPRFRLRLDVSDITEKAEFVIFDYDASFLLCKTCASMVGDALFPSLQYPDDFNVLIGKEVLFKVKVKEDCAFKWDDSFKIKKVCTDEDIIKEFKQDFSIKTPEKSTFKTSLSEHPGEELPAEGGADASIVIDLIDVCNGGELTPILLEIPPMLLPVWLLRSVRLLLGLNELQSTRKRVLGNL
ncbi:Nucleic acid-binding, OB-fold [Sesbania bispinosa]|nr:Nucleic acid-binding, OB-fold [Sesbania bispinosa]